MCEVGATRAARRHSRARAPAAAGVVIVAAALALGGCASRDATAERGAAAPAAAGPQDPVLLDTLERMARTSESRHRYGQAAEQYGRLVKAAPDTESYVLGLARNLRYSGQPQEAVRTLRRAIAEDRLAETLAVRLELARALLAAGAIQDARSQMVTLETEVPNDPRVQALLGILADRDGRHREAQAAYRAAMAGDPEDLRSANNLALSLALTGDLGEAITLQRKTAEHTDATVQMRQNLALLYALAGRMDLAEQVTRSLLPKAQADRVVADLGRLAGRPDAAAIEGAVARP
ncbi:tetratricopeptide repeat protein [Roseospira goensis]|uniref:Flp pilus assembly protein TadD n=1 Tax=Roseospira goensis TaxID=391922 RepID=A0A7W6S1A8_9PROT|nr:tetratricopeptide repeat protein [Roseospira goensis]MBB4287076.1 Flp pilus assembly protein TadD [Roseospira goensis]